MLPDRRPFSELLAPNHVPFECGMDSLKQIVRVYRFHQEVDRTRLHSLDACVEFAFAADEDDRMPPSLAIEAPLHIQTIPIAQSDVQDDATRHFRTIVIQKLLHGRVTLHLVSGCAHQASESRRYLLVIIDYEY